jgi:hypothetical protein
VIEAEKIIKLFGRQKAPEPHFAPKLLFCGSCRQDSLLGFGIHSAVHAADALHEPHRVPGKVVPDEAPFYGLLNQGESATACPYKRKSMGSIYAIFYYQIFPTIQTN